MAANNLPSKILIVDNDQSICNAVTNICSKRSINVITALTWENAIFHFNNNKFDLVIVSLNLEEMPGPVLLHKWRTHEVKSKRDCGFIMTIGGPQTPEEQNIATELGDTVWMHKPIKEPTLLSILAKVMVIKAQREKLRTIQESVLTPLIAKNDVEGIKEVAKTKLPQLGVRGHELAGSVLDEVKEWQDALTTFTTLYQSSQNNMRYLNEIGQLNLKLGRLKEAQNAFEKADSLAPNNIERIKSMAHIYLQQDNPDKGVEKFKQVLSLDPSDPDQKFDMFETLQSFGYEKHAQELCKATTTPLELIRHFNNKGVMYSKQEDYVSAIDEYKKAQKLIPDSNQLYRVLYNEALAHMNLKNQEHYEIALGLLNECLKINKKFDKAQAKIELLSKLIKKQAS